MPSQKNIDRMWLFAKKYAEKVGLTFSPVDGMTEHIPEDHEGLESWGIIKEDFTEVVNAEVSLQPIIGVEQIARLIKGCDSNGN